AEWRFEDLFDRHDLPELARYEVVAGHPVVTPPPSHRHPTVCAQLLVQPTAHCPHAWFVAQDFARRLGAHGRAPDLAALRRGCARALGRGRARSQRARGRSAGRLSGGGAPPRPRPVLCLPNRTAMRGVSDPGDTEGGTAGGYLPAASRSCLSLARSLLFAR